MLYQHVYRQWLLTLSFITLVQFEGELHQLVFEQIGTFIIPEVHKMFRNRYFKQYSEIHPGRYCWFKEMLPPTWKRGVIYLRTHIRHEFKTNLMCSLYVPSMGGEKNGQVLDQVFTIFRKIFQVMLM